MYASAYSVGQFATAPPPSRSSLPIPRLSNKEKGLYSNLFTKADPEGTSKVEGRAAVEFLKKSGLPVDVLKEIWNLSSPNGECFLDRERFYVALRLIALAQQGKPVSLEAITTNIEVDLPVFSSPAERPEADSFEISAEERARYESIFASTAGGKGSLSGFEAKSLFERTGIDIAELSRIWTLADPLDSGVLTKNQFLVAMHLIYKVKQRIRIPDVLPAPLAAILNSVPKPEPYKEFGSLPAAIPPQQPKPDPPRKPDAHDAFPDVSPMQLISFPKAAPPDKRIQEERPVASKPPVVKLHSGNMELAGRDDDPFAEIPRPEVKPPAEVRRESQVKPPAEVRRESQVEQRRNPQAEERRELQVENKREAPVDLRRDYLGDGRREAAFAKVEEPSREAAGPANKAYFQPSREERRQVDDSAIIFLQKSLKAMELQLEELAEELRSTKKEVRLTREDADQQLEDFSKEMRKQRDAMEQQMTDLTKELKTERRSIVETVETAKSVGKSLADCLNAFGTLRVQCEDALKQQQILSAQMQTSLQQSSAQQTKFLMSATEILERNKAEIGTLVRQRPESKPAYQFSEDFTPIKSDISRSELKSLEKTPKIEERPASSIVKPWEQSEIPPVLPGSRATLMRDEEKVTKEEVKEVPRKLGLEPPPTRSEEPKPPAKPPIPDGKVPQTEQKPPSDDLEFAVEPCIIPAKTEASAKDPSPKPQSTIERFDFPPAEKTSSFGASKGSPRVEEFNFEGLPKQAKEMDAPKFPAFDKAPSEPAAAKPDFSQFVFDFSMGIALPEQTKVNSASEVQSGGQKSAQKPRGEGEPRKKSSNSSFDFDVGEDGPQANSLPVGKSTDKRPEEKPKKDEIDFSAAPKEMKSFEFGDFKAFDGAFKPEFNADFQSGVFKFDKGAVQQSKKIAFEF